MAGPQIRAKTLKSSDVTVQFRPLVSAKGYCGEQARVHT